MSVTVTQQLTQQTVTVTGNPVENNVVVTVSNARGPAGDSGGGGASAWDDLTGTASDVPFEPIAAPAYSEGLVFYDSTDKSLTYYNDEADVSMNIGRELWVRVRNDSGSAILNGKVVYINDAVGQLPTIRLARADSATTSRVIGIATHDIGNNEFGYVTTVGEVKGLNTSDFQDGDLLFLSATTAGDMTTTAPLAPNRVIQVATVLHAHITHGKLYCHPETDSIPSTGIVDSTSTGRALITAASASAARTTLELGTLATQSATITDYLTIASASATYQPLDSDLTSWAGVTRASGFDTFTATPSSANLAALVTGETGSGALVFGTSPTFTTSITAPAGSLSVAAINFGDASSGFQAPTSTSIAYNASGVQKFRFDANGFLVIAPSGAASRAFSVFDGSSYPLTAGLNSASVQAFGFGDITSGTLGRFERSTSTGLISFQMQAAASASTTFNIGHASASFRVRAAAAQSAAIQEWRNSSEAVLASVSAAGLGTFVGLTNSGTVTFATGSAFSYASSGISSAHRTALGATTVGDALFTAASTSAARTALELGDLATLNGPLAVASGGTGTTNGSITGTGALTFTAGGSNQNINLTPSGTGLINITGNSGNTVIPVFRATNNYSGGTVPGYVNTFECLAPNLSAGNTIYATLGVSASTNNRGGISFYYAGSGSANNYMAFGSFFGATGVLAAFPNGGVAIAASGTPTSPGAGCLSVSGTTASTSTTTGALIVSGGVGVAGAVNSLYQRVGSGTPEGVVTAPVGAVYHRTNGGAGTSFYVKESGTGNTGWVAK